MTAWTGPQPCSANQATARPRVLDTVIAFSAACTLAATLLFGLVPAAESFRLDLMATMRAGGRGWLSRFYRRAGAALVAGEIMLGFVLVTGAALTARTLARID